jgi:hypothetical protein
MPSARCSSLACSLPQRRLRSNRAHSAPDRARSPQAWRLIAEDVPLLGASFAIRPITTRPSRPRDGAVTPPIRTRRPARPTLGMSFLSQRRRGRSSPSLTAVATVSAGAASLQRRPRRAGPTSAHRHGWRPAPNAVGGASSAVGTARSADSPRPRPPSPPRRRVGSSSRSSTAARGSAGCSTCNASRTSCQIAAQWPLAMARGCQRCQPGPLLLRPLPQARPRAGRP